MQYKLSEILGFEEDTITIETVLDRYFDLCNLNINKFKADLDATIKSNSLYTFPSSDFKIAKNFKLLTISTFLICYEITNNDIFTLNCQQFIDNNKFVTPDVFFYAIVMINEILEKIEVKKWNGIFKDLIDKIDVISKIDPKFFQVNLPVLKDFHVTSSYFDEEFNIFNPINDSVEISADIPPEAIDNLATDYIINEEIITPKDIKKSSKRTSTKKKTPKTNQSKSTKTKNKVSSSTKKTKDDVEKTKKEIKIATKANN